MKHSILILLSLFSCLALHAEGISIDVPRSLLGRDYVIAARVEKVSKPVELGTMKVYAGLRVYNPQIVRFSLEADSLVMTAADAKRGPQRHSVAVESATKESLHVNAGPLFTDILRGVDILSGRQCPGRFNPALTKITLAKGDAQHLEVSVCYTYETSGEPFCITIRKSLLLLPEQPMPARPADKRLGYKSTNGKAINRFDLINRREIVFNISDAFPELWQTAIKEGIEDWNKAFARIGRPALMKARLYSEAGAGFDPFDITSNCFYMVDSDFANAQGNHWTDSRSGEIIQADVQFYRAVAERLKTWLLLHTGAYNKTIADGNVPDSIMQRMLRYAAAHEIGHCLGLEHNYRASSAYATTDLRNPAFCLSNGTTPSIMDYARFNYVAQPSDGVSYVYPPLLGDYDLYAIEAGYRDFADDAAYRAFVDDHQSSPRCLYTKLHISTLPTDKDVQPSDLGNDPMLSSQLGIRNIAALPEAVLRQMKATDVHAFYFQLLMHCVPCLDNPEVKAFVEKEINSGYRVLDSEKMRGVYGSQLSAIEDRRAEFIAKVSKQYALDVKADPLSAGQWMPHQMVSDDVFSLLKKDGIRLSKKDIYNINKRCLTGAALSLSTSNGLSTPYATASFVSKDGLVMTNFHCVSNHVQRLAKGDNDYMRYGCWAGKREEEAPLFGIEVHQVLSVEDITARVLAGTECLDADARDAKANERAQQMMKDGSREYGINMKAYSLNGGQQYVMVRYRTFKDVRIVACPPMWLGAYGGDDDNWRWPRYSCDFAFLRVYASPEGETSEYSKRNVPYHPQSYLRFTEKGVADGDLAIVMGYPSQTRKNIPAFALDRIVNNDTQLRANSLKAKIDYLRKCREKSVGTARSGYDVRIGKLMNVWLRSKGEIDGVRATSLVDAKRKEDMELQQWINADSARKALYGENLIAQMDSVYQRLTVYNHMDEAFSQFVGSGAGIIPFAGKFEKLLSIDRAKRKSRKEDMEFEIPEIRRNLREFFPSISMEEDCGMMKTLLPLYLKAVPKKYLPQALQQSVDMDRLYATSLLTDSARLERFIDESIDKGTDELRNDTLYRICLDIYMNRVQKQNREATPLRRLNTKLYGLYRRAMAEKNAGRLILYDANHTLRFSTGRVMARTSMADMLQRNDSMPPRFRRLLEEASSLPTACISTNAETASGNSGSPVLNAKGEVIGLNFDRTAQSAFSIYRNDPLRMRNICVSTDYILWVIRNYSHSQYILPELLGK